MNCRNCGAPMELVEPRGYFYCRYCSSFVFPEPTGPDGVRVLGSSPRQVTCPVCTKTLASAVLDDSHPAHYCEHCRGVLLSRRAFADVTRRRRAKATGPATDPIAAAPRERDRRIACPLCGEEMATHPYYGPGNVIIDSCGSCDAIWLDFGELRQIVDAPGRDRGAGEREPAGERGWDPDATTGRVLMNPEPEKRRGPARGRARGKPDLLKLLDEWFA